MGDVDLNWINITTALHLDQSGFHATEDDG
ncbi:hypothetical protein C5167_004004 [Papaver somniferum]|nr:hypothetical protein C5167_004004 [Papaver somniferum]